LKQPEAEMARLAHNDYLEQGSDSGVIGLISYTAFIAGSLIWSWRTLAKNQSQEDLSDAAALVFPVWLGLLGWCLQGLLEFGLYIPGLAWPAFAMLGWLLARTARVKERTIQTV
jgi:O-antigen ligase